MIIIRVLALFIACATANLARAEDMAETSCDATCQRTQINAYYAGIDAIMMAGSTIDDIDTFLRGLHNDVRYIHEEYGAEFDKDTWHRAFIRQREQGSYNNGPDGKTSVLRVIHGYKFAAVEFRSRYTEGATQIETPPRLAIFRFTDGKISQIKEHWYHLAEQ